MKNVDEMRKECEAIEKDLLSMKVVLKIAEEEAEGASPNSEIAKLYQSIKSKIRQQENRKTKLFEEINFKENLKPDKHIEFLFFKAGHRGFRTDEMKQLAQHLLQFKGKEVHELTNIDFQMSDEAIIYATEPLNKKEAQYMWEFYWDHQFDEHDQERYEHGDLMIWNGKELVDNNGNPIIK